MKNYPTSTHIFIYSYTYIYTYSHTHTHIPPAHQTAAWSCADEQRLGGGRRHAGAEPVVSARHGREGHGHGHRFVMGWFASLARSSLVLMCLSFDRWISQPTPTTTWHPSCLSPGQSPEIVEKICKWVAAAVS